ncbi:MAG: DUF3152 domain-containing protein, partial [Micromonosporaceae bacterium]
MPVPVRPIAALLLVVGVAVGSVALFGPDGVRRPTAAAARALPHPSPSPTSPPPVIPSPTTTPSSTPPPKPAPPRTPSKTRTSPPAGASTYRYAVGTGPILGSAGTVRTFRVAVENGVGVAVEDFTATVESTLGDARSWVAGNTLRFQRVESGANFTIYLVSPATADQICRSGGVDIRVGGVPYTSCRVGAKVVINSARYLTGVPNYGAPLSAYRQYVINHEVGHWLGHHHELCPGSGQLAPVMEQQTLSLAGCVANSWPYVDGV